MTQTLQFSLTEGAWTEISDGQQVIRLQVKTANRVLLHYNNSATAPALNAPAFLVESFPPRWDYEATDLQAQSRLWVRAENQPCIVVVARRTA